MVAISRETSTSTGQSQWLQGIERLIHVQIVVVVAVVAKRKTSTQIVAVVAINQSINQSIKTPFTRESTVYTGLDKVLNGRIVFLYNPFMRNRANSVTILLIQVRTNFCQSQLWNGFLIKGAELRSKLLTRKLFHGRTDRTGQNFRPTADQVKNVHGF